MPGRRSPQQTVALTIGTCVTCICRRPATLVDGSGRSVTSTRTMLAADFIDKWRAADLTERAAAQSHFRDLCDLLGEQAPSDAHSRGEWYAFEKGATKTTGREGWADV